MEDPIIHYITRSPGKVLLCGGYLILKPKNCGLVANVNSYFQCKSNVKFLREKWVENENKIIKINIKSINYDTKYNYELSIKVIEDKLFVSLSDELKKNNNNFLYFSVLFSFYLVILKFSEENFLNHIGEINFTLNGDNNFYTFEKEKSSNFNKNYKTGLGSSSAMITSIISNIYLIFKANKINQKRKGALTTLFNQEEIGQINLFAILANNFAQKKIGSGFDIQSCLIGSHIFTRCEFIDQFLELFQINAKVYIIDENIKSKIKEFSNLYIQNYFNKIIYLENLDFIKVNLISLFKGSDTRILVSKVIEWSKKNQKEEFMDNEIFIKINQINREIINLFFNLKSRNQEDFKNLKEKNFQLRKLIRQLSLMTDVPIEPKETTEFLDKLMALSDEIIFGIVPGAGGYDALVVLSIGYNLQIEIANFLEEYSKTNKIDVQLIEVNFPLLQGTLYEVVK